MGAVKSQGGGWNPLRNYVNPNCSSHTSITFLISFSTILSKIFILCRSNFWPLQFLLSVASPLYLKQFTMTLVSHSEGILFSFNIHLKRLVILSKAASPDANSIYVTTPDVPGALHFFILVKYDFTFSVYLLLRSNYWIF